MRIIYRSYHCEEERTLEGLAFRGFSDGGQSGGMEIPPLTFLAGLVLVFSAKPRKVELPPRCCL